MERSMTTSSREMTHAELPPLPGGLDRREGAGVSLTFLTLWKALPFSIAKTSSGLRQSKLFSLPWRTFSRRLSRFPKACVQALTRHLYIEKPLDNRGAEVLIYPLIGEGFMASTQMPSLLSPRPFATPSRFDATRLA